jgi:hypothetical protein
LVPLVQDKPELLAPQTAQFPNSPAYFRAWAAYNASIAKYYLDFQPDGAFRVDDVLPGQYTLAFCVTAPPANPLSENAWMDRGPVLGGITNKVTVPPISGERLDEPLDLGAILVPMVDLYAGRHGSQHALARDAQVGCNPARLLTRPKLPEGFCRLPHYGCAVAAVRLRPPGR